MILVYVFNLLDADDADDTDDTDLKAALSHQ